MPEGDTAYRAAYHLARSLTGRTIDRFELRVPKFAQFDLTGEKIRGADARGKHILLRIGDHTVHSHLGMDGSWRLVPPGSSGGRATRSARDRTGGARGGPTLSWPAAHRIRAIIGTDAVIALGIDLAKLECWRTADEPQRLGWLGPDLLAAEPDLAEARRRILAQPGRSITAALLDQRNVAGLGNEYVTEMCFLCGVLPSRTVAEAGDIDEWLTLGRQLMLANRDRVERTFTGDLRRPNWVFGREGRQCRRCGSDLVSGTHESGSARSGATERESVWCPNCQR
ncbi:DNA-formamidopyrimidine glycosylase family protein [uncultured Gulosibacter sp.]|uniref:DNA-formamidopyrimidine glycosylase family protein n=1 Tax=uncultured Gulosibacter sp. TaxID=1339167 RepID=UPI0028895CB9|nr:DNA-formamidopyrimidine glycosylase family protein [uncultured Gulosibacter sp.]